MKVQLCESRHVVLGDIDGYIFPNTIEDVTNVMELEEIALNSITKLGETSHLDIYVTGLTVALIATLNVARKCNIDVTLLHYDRENGKYFSQHVER